jgi:hypothetical protein
MNQGESKTFAFEITTDDTLNELIAYVGNKKYLLELSGNLHLLKLSDVQTDSFSGTLKVSLSVDLENYGHQKIDNVFEIKIDRTNAVITKGITSDVISLTAPITINQQDITVDSIVYDYLQGPQGDTGPQGIQGIQGIDGNDGIDGKSILNGVVNPTTEGDDGDFYINTITNEIFGPKEAGTWGSGTSLIGPQGDPATEINDLTTSVTWANIPDGNVPESAVTQHEEALSIAWSQVTSKPFIPTVDDTAYDSTSWNTNIDAPTKNAVRDKIESMDSAISLNTVKVSFPGFTSLSSDYGFTDNSSNWDTAYGWGNHALENYLIAGDINTLENINTIITDATLITDAPSDGSTYGRNNGRWVTVSGGAAGGVYQVELAEGQFTDGDKTKLDGIEVGATANDQERDLNSQTVTSYTLALTDANDSITMNNAAANTVTIPTNDSVAFPIGTTITVWMLGSGVTSITADTGVTLSGNGGTAVAGSCDIQTQYNAAVLLKIDTNSWLVSGNINPVS